METTDLSPERVRSLLSSPIILQLDRELGLFDYISSSLPPGSRVLAAMSGGVDSSVAAGLMKIMGFEVIGITLRLNRNEIRSCCSDQDIQDAKEVAMQMGFTHYILDYADLFSKNVVDNFREEYLSGRTPSPCVRCNQHIKFGHLVHFAKQMEASAIATGHYIRHGVSENRLSLYRCEENEKDQTYFMSMIPKASIEIARFPLGLLKKPQVRAIAEEMGLLVAQKAESQDLCFVRSGRYKDMLKGMASKVNKGLVVDSAGEFLGYHEGVHAYTIGQRKGIEVPNGPWFVLEINAVENKIVIGREHELAKTSFEITEVNLLQEEMPEVVSIKIRAQHRMVKARLHVRQESQESALGEDAVGTKMLVETLEPVTAVSPGQICAFYDEDKLLGGGTIL